MDLIIVFVDDGNASQIHQITKILIPGHFTTLFISNLSFLNMIFIADVKTVIGPNQLLVVLTGSALA